MNDLKILIKNINDSKLLINKEIKIFLYCLILRIFLRKRKKTSSIKADEKLKIFIGKINKEIIKEENKEISEEYSVKNLSNIFDFVKKQNILFASEILENILIIIFSFAFKTEKENSFGKYLHNNMDLIKRMKNSDWIKWLLLNEFKGEIPGREAENFKIFLENEFLYKNKNQSNQIHKSINRPIILFLLDIYNNKKKYQIKKIKIHLILKQIQKYLCQI